MRASWTLNVGTHVRWSKISCVCTNAITQKPASHCNSTCPYIFVHWGCLWCSLWKRWSSGHKYCPAHWFVPYKDYHSKRTTTCCVAWLLRRNGEAILAEQWKVLRVMNCGLSLANVYFKPELGYNCFCLFIPLNATNLSRVAYVAYHSCICFRRWAISLIQRDLLLS